MGDLREQLLEIRAQVGRLTPQDVVDSARPEESPLHSRFEWDDQIAGEAFRRTQAAELIRRVRVVYKPSEDAQFKSIRAFHAVPSGVNESSYEPVHEVLADPITRVLLMRQMERDWKALRQRYEDFTEFWDLVRADVSATG